MLIVLFLRKTSDYLLTLIWEISMEVFKHCLDITAESTVKILKNLDNVNSCCNHPKIWTIWIYHRVMHSKDADGIANSVDPDQTAPQSDLGLHRLPRPICLKTSDHYGIFTIC